MCYLLDLVNFGLRLKAKVTQISSYFSSGLRKRTNKLKRTDCPVIGEVRSNEDGSWTITMAMLKHKGFFKNLRMCV